MGARQTHSVLITTSGTGSRLGDITKYTNKALVKVGKKPAISYIIEAYPKDTEFVITVGYLGNQVRDFLDLVYPDRHFTFVSVDKYEGEGTSLGYSMLKASKHLQKPFIYHACDTIVADKKIPSLSTNWIGGFKGEGSSLYASFDVLDGHVHKIHEKGMLNSDLLHIGLVGVQDYRAFWKALKGLYEANPNDSTLSDVATISVLLNTQVEFRAIEFPTWYDIGNVESLNRARVEIADSFRILDKVDESIFIFDAFVVKFFANEKMVEQRVKRAKFLKGLVPEIEGFKKNFYRYRYANGRLYSKVATPKDFRHFLLWSKKNLWLPVRETTQDDFRKVCHDFYVTKTVERVGAFLKSRSIQDREDVINGEKVPTVKAMLEAIDFEAFCSAEQTGFHGDFILDNILKSGSTYTLLDWRQNFGGLLKAGDCYYDLAKLNHNLVVNHEIVNKDLFTIEITKNAVECDILRHENLVRCQEALFAFIREGGYDEKKVRILTAIIWLNMSPLHHHPFDLFLFYFGKLNLWRAIQES